MATKPEIIITITFNNFLKSFTNNAKKVKLVVSYPFSTTALIAKKQNIESIYYFPSKLKNKPLVDEDIKILE